MVIPKADLSAELRAIEQAIYYVSILVGVRCFTTNL